MEANLVVMSLVTAHVMVLLVLAWTFRVRQENGLSVIATRRFRFLFLFSAGIWILFGLDRLYPGNGFYEASAGLFLICGFLFIFALAALVLHRFGKYFPVIVGAAVAGVFIAWLSFGSDVAEAVTGLFVGSTTIAICLRKDVYQRNEATRHYVWLGVVFVLASALYIAGLLFAPSYRLWLDAGWLVLLGASSNLIVVVTMLVANKAIQNVLRHKALTDPLTGLMNRRALLRAWQYIQAESSRQDLTPGLVICDLDRFKRVNDVYGHDVGDGVLIAFSGVMRRICRAGDRLARIGGEEFVILVSDATEESLHTLAERLRHEMGRSPTRIGEVEVHCTISAGVGLFAPGEGFDHAFSRVDSALYRAKHNGRDCVEHALFPGAFLPEAS